MQYFLGHQKFARATGFYRSGGPMDTGSLKLKSHTDKGGFGGGGGWGEGVVKNYI